MFEWFITSSVDVSLRCADMRGRGGDSTKYINVSASARQSGGCKVYPPRALRRVARDHMDMDSGVASSADTERPSRAQESIWENLVRRAQKEVAFTHPKAQNYAAVMSMIFAVFSKLKHDHPEYVVDVIMLFLPRTSSAYPLGKFPLLPHGLPNPALDLCTEEALDELLVDMATSKVYDGIQIDRATAEEKITESNAKLTIVKSTVKAKGSPAKSPAKSKAKVKAAPLSDETAGISWSANDMIKSFLAHLTDTSDYMHTRMNPDGQFTMFFEGFINVSLAGAIAGQIELLLAGSLKKIGSFQMVRKSAKMALYRSAKLVPRMSDADFEPGAD